MDLRRIFSPQNSQKGRLFSANHYLMEKEWANDEAFAHCDYPGFCFGLKPHDLDVSGRIYRNYCLAN
jgi:hypothetical protein